ncbi:MAG: hypothetical protein ACTSRK_12560 [Promethearchaeota archaeon]
MGSHKKKPIYPPSDMPTRFFLKGREYKWYRTLSRNRKRYLLRLFRDNRDLILDSRINDSQILEQNPILHGVTIMFWDERAGPRVLKNYPSDFSLPMPSLMQMYANFLAMEGETNIHLEINHIQYSARRIISPEDNHIFIIVHSENVEDLIAFEHTLNKWSKLLLKKPDLVFQNKNTEMDYVVDRTLDDWLISGEINEIFINNIYISLRKLIYL